MMRNRIDQQIDDKIQRLKSSRRVAEDPEVEAVISDLIDLCALLNRKITMATRGVEPDLR
jgi:hypothetical protein